MLIFRTSISTTSTLKLIATNVSLLKLKSDEANTAIECKRPMRCWDARWMNILNFEFFMCKFVFFILVYGRFVFLNIPFFEK